MALTSKITITLSHPDEPGVTITIRKLSHHQLMMATDVKRFAAISLMQALEGVVLPDTDKDKTPDEKAAAKAQAEADAKLPEATYDRTSVLGSGVTEWSYGVPVADGITDLDEETAAWLFAEIIAFSVRSKDEGKEFASASQPSTGQAEVVGPPS